MNSPSFDIVSKMLDEGTFSSGQLFVGPDPLQNGANVEAAHAICRDTGGTSNPAWLRDTPTIQFFIRSAANDYPGGYALAQGIKDALLGKKPFTINNADYIRFVIEADIIHLGEDDNNRSMFSLRFEVTREFDDYAASQRTQL